MTPQDWVTVVQSLGVPVVMCMLMGFYIKYVGDKNREQLEAITKTHHDEVSSITNALNNNTLVLQKLCDRFESEGK